MNSSVSYRKVGDYEVGQRLDNFLIKILKGVPKSKIYRIVRSGEVRVNGGRVKPMYRIKLGDEIRIPPIRMAQRGQPVAAGQSLIATLKEQILFEDNGLLIINKPSGLAVHGGSGVNIGLIEALRQIYPKEPRLELVHRLDRETSGCIMVAKKSAVLKALHEQLQQSAVDKVYTALLSGQLQKKHHWVEAPLQKNVLKSGERVVRVSEQGKSASTQFEVTERFKDSTLVIAKPVTGRTHQIRVHAQFLGHPILGDTRYGHEVDNKMAKSVGVNRLFLHAASLGFVNPSTDQRLEVSAPLPPDLLASLPKLN